MQVEKNEPAAAAVAGGKPPSICDRLQKAFHARPAFWPLRRLGGAPAGAAKPAAAGAGGAPAGTAATHGGPPTPVPSPVPTAPSTPTVALKSAAKKGGQPTEQRDGQVPASAAAVTEKVAAATTPPGMPVPAPAPPASVAGTPPDAKTAGDKAQPSKGKTRVSSRVRKALSSK